MSLRKKGRMKNIENAPHRHLGTCDYNLTPLADMGNDFMPTAEYASANDPSNQSHQQPDRSWLCQHEVKQS